MANRRRLPRRRRPWGLWGLWGLGLLGAFGPLDIAGPCLSGVEPTRLEPVSLLVAVAGKSKALSLAGEPGCPDDAGELQEALEAWATASHGRLEKGSSSYRMLGIEVERKKMNKLWEEGHLLVSCYDAFAWLRTGRCPVHGQPPSTEDVLRSMGRVLERPPAEASDDELRAWIGREYGEDGLKRLLASQESLESPTESASPLVELKEFFTWFRRNFPYYHGHCERCMRVTHFLGVARPSDDERQEGGAGVSEVNFCEGCNVSSLFPRFRRVRPVLDTHRGRCGEYSWLALRFLEALGFPARWVDNHAGHAWVEAWVENRCGRWVHIDPCEAAVDEPLLYAEQWGRCPLHVLAYQATAELAVSVEDVTSTYRPADAEAVPEEISQKVTEAVAEARMKLDPWSSFPTQSSCIDTPPAPHSAARGNKEEKRRAASKSSKKCDRVSVWPGQVWWLEPAQGVKTFGQEGAVR
ncbi:unnamed protein product [Durusdinium trenchii]|uniref:Transglutaminase-like domain-containing protein n=1 Tax=Durusdinium trenchii TaxID=1381693 RepID=A0ABP0P557_9DINO